MRELSQILYSELKEEDKALTGWSKSTVDYILNHRTRICNTIRGIAKGLTKILQKADVENIYQEVLMYMHTCDDYNISKACERSSNGDVVSLEGYVHSCVKYCVIRYVTKQFDHEKNEVSEVTKDEDGKELSKFDTIVDINTQGFDDYCYEIKEVCRSSEHERYQFGPDIFQIWYVRLLTMIYNKEDKYIDILTVLGVSKADIANIHKAKDYDGAMLSIARAVSIVGIESAVDIIREYTYSADKIKRVVELF